MNFFTFFALLLGLQGIIASLDVTNCGGSATLESVEVTGCDKSPCTFARGKSYSLFVKMIAKGDSAKLTYSSSAFVFNRKVDLLSGNGCTLLVGSEKCPVKNGAKLEFKFDVRVPIILPQIPQVVVNATIFADDQSVQVCAGLPVKIV